MPNNSVFLLYGTWEYMQFNRNSGTQ